MITHTHRGEEVQGDTGGYKCLSNSKMCHTSYKTYRIITDVFNLLRCQWLSENDQAQMTFSSHLSQCNYRRNLSH